MGSVSESSAAGESKEPMQTETAEWNSVETSLPRDGQKVFARYEGVYDMRPVTFWRDTSNGHFGLPTEPDGRGSQPATHWRDAEAFLETCH